MKIELVDKNQVIITSNGSNKKYELNVAEPINEQNALVFMYDGSEILLKDGRITLIKGTINVPFDPINNPKVKTFNPNTNKCVVGQPVQFWKWCGNPITGGWVCKPGVIERVEDGDV